VIFVADMYFIPLHHSRKNVLSPTVVEWNKVDVTYCGGVVIQNMSPTVVE
jgi:hypothetical protein